MRKEKLQDILRKHQLWFKGREDGEKANLSEADLRRANLTGANLTGANLRRADLSRADLSEANLSEADLRRANLTGANLSGADLSEADLSGAEGLVVPSNYLTSHFEVHEQGIIVYKIFSLYYCPPKCWSIESGSIITEVVNPCRVDECASGINVATLDWCKKCGAHVIWRCLIDWVHAADIIVPYNTDGKIRTGWLQLLERVELPKAEEVHGK